ncbi:UDP-2,3-diacylglucosamine diphosphatase [Legionella lytica]|uniref:UDP-2,3-diacylglucosamine hydrolase n=1 Tax=Legionella lytica TaxID=96232 RepID=A0ABW8D5I8_9GAMM
MIDAVFISDLHLHPEEYNIQAHFDSFLKWAVHNSVKNIYILGDFFHAWAGDDTLNDWSRGIAEQLHALTRQGINLFYMHGNRDFLLGKRFAKLAGWSVLKEPTIIYLDNEKIMLVHGDRYCTNDVAHQRFRLLTRNKIFPALFLSLSAKYRERLVNQVRTRSQNNMSKSMEQMDVVTESVMRHMQEHGVSKLVHGHTHKPGLTTYPGEQDELMRYVLSDWDDNPKLLCYCGAKGLYFTHM